VRGVGDKALEFGTAANKLCDLNAAKNAPRRL